MRRVSHKVVVVALSIFANSIGCRSGRDIDDLGELHRRRVPQCLKSTINSVYIVHQGCVTKDRKTFALTCARGAQAVIRARGERTSAARRTSGIIGSICMTRLWFRANLIARAVTRSPLLRTRRVPRKYRSKVYTISAAPITRGHFRSLAKNALIPFDFRLLFYWHGQSTLSNRSGIRTLRGPHSYSRSAKCGNWTLESG